MLVRYVNSFSNHRNPFCYFVRQIDCRADKSEGFNRNTDSNETGIVDAFNKNWDSFALWNALFKEELALHQHFLRHVLD